MLGTPVGRMAMWFGQHAPGVLEATLRNAKLFSPSYEVSAPELRGTVAFHVAGSEQDPYEPRQITAARERLAPFGVAIRTFPGGHLTTSEHPELLADAIRGLARAHGVGQPSETEGLREGISTPRPAPTPSRA